MSGDAAEDIEHPPAWHALDGPRLLVELGSDAVRGLDEREVLRRRAHAGPNELGTAPRRSGLETLLAQFKSPLIYLLLVSAVIALALGHVGDAVVIAVVVGLNAVIGAFQEGRAERALEALRSLTVMRARVVREGCIRDLPARELVPGDLIALEAGDAVPADARLIDVAALQASEAALTGESLAVAKQNGALPVETPLAERSNMVFTGTYITAGRGRALVTVTGARSEVGTIAALAQRASGGQTPLEQRVAQFGRTLVKAAAALLVLVVGVGLLRGVPLAEIAMLGISQVVGMIPEGLPVAMTIALAVGVQRMARRKVVVRRLTAVETLGSTTVICTDKTGTLTRNEMMVTELVTAGGRAFTVTGDGYRPEGEIREHGDPAPIDSALRALLEAAVLCNDAELRMERDAPVAVGDPTELALLAVAMKGGISWQALRSEQPRVGEIPFDPIAKLMATEHRRDGRARVLVKGAPEELLALSGTSDGLQQHAERLARAGLRVLAFACGDELCLEPAASFEPLRGRLKMLGLLAQTDPVRPEVAGAVLRCQQAGVRVVMITGDHKQTGLAIAGQLAIIQPGEEAIDGRELDALSDDQLRERLGRVAVFARVRPAQKLRIVAAYKQRGEVVAMTGDGVNDAPALMEADVGVAMGLAGSEVAKEAAKILIGDDNFASIVAAVEEGRVVYRNIQKAVLLLLSTSLAEVAVLVLALLFGLPAPFAAVQILWNNLVTEGLITVNLVMEPAEGNEMRTAPIRRSSLLGEGMVGRLVMMSSVILAVTLGWYSARIASGVPLAQVRSETFTLLALCEWFNVLNCRSSTRSALRLGLWRNPWLLGGLAVGNALQAAVIFWPPLRKVFHTVPFGVAQILELGALASLVMWSEELRKWRARRAAAGRPALWARVFGPKRALSRSGGR